MAIHQTPHGSRLNNLVWRTMSNFIQDVNLGLVHYLLLHTCGKHVKFKVGSVDLFKEETGNTGNKGGSDGGTRLENSVVLATVGGSSNVFARGPYVNAFTVVG